ncbi:hypothetical protein BDP27DRAFT_1426756 [Rhodocollybia butyracea]|uniref:Uncharacterized protein n=2 Tax=Rhodocollybia butyracea TaxID=206335 RepID=A0A9P5PKD1_9AGAR|nr:hypothetical protein BDP27DRAFT_1426756 [Rhodocollybia butyracea]
MSESYLTGCPSLKGKQSLVKFQTRTSAKQRLQAATTINHNSQSWSTKDVLAIRDWLKAPVSDPSTNFLAACYQRTPGTAEWILSHPQYIQWQQSEQAGTLWIQGKVGSGKTILSSAIIKALQANRAVLCCYYYFDNCDNFKTKTTSRGLLQSLVLQMATRTESVHPVLHRLYKECKEGGIDPTTKGLGATLAEAVKGWSHVFLVLDAMDECSEAIEVFKYLAPLKDNLYIMVTSQYMAETSLGVSWHIHLDNAQDAFNQDVAKYLQDKFGKLQPELFTEIVDVLTKGAQGQFRWVDCQVTMLQNCGTPESMREALKKLPKTLEETYTIAVERIRESEYVHDASQLLMWLAYAFEPLSTAQVTAILCVDLETQVFHSEVWSLKLENKIYDVLGSTLITVKADNIIKIAHSSVKEFLTQTHAQVHIGTLFETNEHLAHSAICQTCLIYLLQFDSRQMYTSKDYPLALYAAKFWPVHMGMLDNKVPEYKPAKDLVMKFLQQSNQLPYVNWIRICDPYLFNLDPSEISTPLYYMALNGLSSISELLLIEDKADVNVQGGKYGNPLQAAARSGNKNIVQLLLEHKADVNAQGGMFGSALQAAVTSRNKDIVQLLLEHCNADVNAQGGMYGNALQEAVNSGGKDIVQLLLEHKANVNAQGSVDGSALQVVASSQSKDRNAHKEKQADDTKTLPLVEDFAITLSQHNEDVTQHESGPITTKKAYPELQILTDQVLHQGQHPQQKLNIDWQPSVKVLQDWNAEQMVQYAETPVFAAANLDNNMSLIYTSGHPDEKIIICDLSAGKTSYLYGNGSSVIKALSISPDGSKIGCGTSDGRVKIWDIVTPNIHRTFNGHNSSVDAIDFCADGVSVISGADDGSIMMWDLETGRCKSRLENHIEQVSHVFCSTDNATVVSIFDGVICISKSPYETCTHLFQKDAQMATSAATSPDGSKLVCGFYDGQISVWNLSTYSKEIQFKGHSDPVQAVAWSPDGNKVASGSNDRMVKIWDIIHESSEHKMQGHDTWLQLVKFFPTGLRLLSVSIDYTVIIWDTLLGKMMYSFNSHVMWVTAVTVSSDSLRIAYGSNDNTVQIWNSSKSIREHVLAKHTDCIEAVIFSPDNQKLASGAFDNAIIIWDVFTGVAEHILKGHARWIKTILISPHGTKLVSGSFDNTARIWNMSTAISEHTLEGHTQAVTCLAVSPDESKVVSGSNDKDIIVWNAESGNKEYILEGHITGLLALAFSSDGSMIISGAEDNLVYIWNTSTHEKEHILNKDARMAINGLPLGLLANDIQFYVLSGNENQILKVTCEQFALEFEHAAWLPSQKHDISCITYHTTMICLGYRSGDLAVLKISTGGGTYMNQEVAPTQISKGYDTSIKQSSFRVFWDKIKYQLAKMHFHGRGKI